MDTGGQRVVVADFVFQDFERLGGANSWVRAGGGVGAVGGSASPGLSAGLSPAAAAAAAADHPWAALEAALEREAAEELLLGDQSPARARREVRLCRCRVP